MSLGGSRSALESQPVPIAPCTAQDQKVLSAGRARGPANRSPPRSREREDAPSSVKGSLSRASPPLTELDAPTAHQFAESEGQILHAAAQRRLHDESSRPAHRRRTVEERVAERTASHNVPMHEISQKSSRECIGSRSRVNRTVGQFAGVTT